MIDLLVEEPDDGCCKGAVLNWMMMMAPKKVFITLGLESIPAANPAFTTSRGHRHYMY